MKAWGTWGPPRDRSLSQKDANPQEGGAEGWREDIRVLMPAEPDGKSKPAPLFREAKVLLGVLPSPVQPGFLSLATKSSDSPREGGSHRGGNASTGCRQAFQY